ncbi:MAG: DUF4399 domain-containing protein [Pseudomonadota bacterium]
MKPYLAAAALSFAALPALAQDRTPANPEAEVYFVTLEDGATVSGPVTVAFGLKGMGVAPAGTLLEMTGHHHLLINRAPYGTLETDAEFFEFGIPGDENHIHFGGGQTETTLQLAPGTYTMQLLLGDVDHIPHDPVIASEVITITVTE